MAVKKTLLEIVRLILSDLDSEDVNSISDSVEAQQIADIVEQTFYNHVATEDIAEHADLIKITAASDSTTPTHFTLEDNTRRIDELWYIHNTDNDYRELDYRDFRTFLWQTDSIQEDFDTVLVNGTKIRIRNNKSPEFYTSFDNDTIICDSYDSSVESTLQESKVRAWGHTIPVFVQSDAAVPDLIATQFPYLIMESTSTAFEVLKGSVSQKMEQGARRTRARIHNDRHRVPVTNKRPDYGRRR